VSSKSTKSGTPVKRGFPGITAKAEKLEAQGAPDLLTAMTPQDLSLFRNEVLNFMARLTDGPTRKGPTPKEYEKAGRAMRALFDRITAEEVRRGAA
jgi:hypothetical protein